jgi:hypothetical protein
MRFKCRYNLELPVTTLLYLQSTVLPIQLVYLTSVPLEAPEGRLLRQEALGELLSALIYLAHWNSERAS